ncbi:hypothetical protein AVEN_88566-1 [Araneus ventricosus]|uniref:Uncharacterized protein n=1 Tax=Araneus ventricosus TaxID=182803 RepID=A0A4Y2X6E9_ARAVE|nr:hypothetical protein AVEN_88566-1 [Araneus ventricosus]
MKRTYLGCYWHGDPQRDSFGFGHLSFPYWIFHNAGIDGNIRHNGLQQVPAHFNCGIRWNFRYLDIFKWSGIYLQYWDDLLGGLVMVQYWNLQCSET